MNSLILQGSKFVMDTGPGRRSFHLDLSMVFGDCTCHSHIVLAWPILPATSFHDVWKSYSCDLVLTGLLVGLASPMGFLELSFVYP